MHKNVSTVRIILSSALKNAVLSIGTIAAVAGAIVTALIPPLVLERIVNTLTEGKRPGIMLVSAYFGIILMAGLAESARESLLSVFGQRITRSLRHELCGKLSRLDTGCFVQQTPGEIVSRFVGDVDTVENLFTGGIIGMTADLGKIISILAVIFIKDYCTYTDAVHFHEGDSEANASCADGQPGCGCERFRLPARNTALHPHSASSWSRRIYAEAL